MKVIYEGTIGAYSFQMIDDKTIEVWGYDNEYPESYIYIKPNSITTKKDFDYEIMAWASHNGAI